MTFWSELVHDTVSLVAILNPIAAAAIMLSLVPPTATRRYVRQIAKRTSLIVLLSCLSTVIFGDLIFKLFGIGVSSIKVIGGIVLVSLALNMVHGNMQVGTRHSPEESSEAQEKEDISVVPLGIPILFGPGVLATLIVLKTRALTPQAYLALMLAVAVSVFVTFLILDNAAFLRRFLGITGFKIITRIMGLIVGAIAVQFVISGVKALWLGKL